MTPDEEKELDEFLAGLAGEAKPGSGAGFDELDARLADDMRTLDRKWQSEPTEFHVAQAWSKIKPVSQRRLFALPFASGLAAGALLALGATLALQTLRQAEPDLGYKGGEIPTPAGMTWSAELPSSNPQATALELAVLLEREGRSILVNTHGETFVVGWLHTGVSPDSPITKWLRSKGIIVPAGTEQVALTISPSAAE